jgi:thioredoxin 1
MAADFMEITDDNFEEKVVKSGKPVLVDFWAPWCGPCKAVAPMLEDLSGSYGNKVLFAKCNVDDNPVTPGKFGIKSIPTLIFFNAGKVAEQIVGMVARQKVEASIKNVLAGQGGSPFVTP